MRPTRRFAIVTALAALVVAPVVVSAASAGASASASVERAPVQASDASNPALATLAVSTDHVSVRKDGKKKFKPATDGQGLREGDTIKTDATGTAEVDYGNEAFTRLDVNTTFTIVVLTDEQGARQVQGSLESGQTWNRTAALTETGSFEQEGAGANATVRGTAFSILCDAVDHCTFTAVVDDIDLTGLDGVTRLLTPLTQCESNDSTEGGELRDLTGVLCGDITQIPADQLSDWILQNLLKDLTLGLPDGGILTGTVVISPTGVVSFVPGPAPATTPPPLPPVIAAPQIDDPPIEVDYGSLVDGAARALDFSPSSSIDVFEGDSADFAVRVVEGFAGNLYVVFTKLPNGVGTVRFSGPHNCGETCDAELDNRVYVRDEDHPDARYRVDTVFSFEADDGLGCDDFSCASSVFSDDMEFYVENEAGNLTSETAHVDVTVEEDAGPCAADVGALC